MPDGEVDIHTIWKIWGPGGLIEKIGPERTIRELKKRGEAGAIIGWTLYKLLIDKWMDVALGARDLGERGPAEDFMAAAGEDELVKRIEDLHTQYPDGIPRSIRFDLRDEFNDNLQKKVGRKIPLEPKDASKKDIEESKKIAKGLSEIEPAPAPAAPKPPPKREEVRAVPAPVPVPVRAPEAPAVPAPPAAPPTPITAIPDKLELMKAEIRRRAEEERRRRMGGGSIAGEPVDRSSGWDERTKTKYLEELLVDEFIVKQGRKPNPGEMQGIRDRIERLIRKYGTYTYKGLENTIYSTLKIEELEDMVLAIHVSNLTSAEKQKLISKIRERRSIFKGGRVEDELSKFETAKRIVSTMTAPGTESEEKLEISPVFIRCPGRPGFMMCPGCRFKYTVTSASACPYGEAFRGTIGEGDIKKIVGLVVRETGEPETTLSKSFLAFIERVEQVKDMQSLTDLREYFDNVDTITVMTEYDKLQLKQFIIQRMQDILEYYEKGRPAFPEQFREGNVVKEDNRKDGDTMTEPRDYTQWTFADFEALIASLEDIEDLEELYEYIDASDKLSESDRITLRNLVKTRIDELAAGYAELSKIRG